MSGINSLTEGLKQSLISVINQSGLPAVSIKLVCSELKDLADKEYEMAIRVERATAISEETKGDEQ